MGSAGLGYVHSIAGPMGALHPVPHGVACGHLLAPITNAIVLAMREDPQNHVVRFEKLNRLSQLWKVEGPRGVLEFLEGLESLAQLPSLNTYGFCQDEIPGLVESAAQRGSPVVLSFTVLSTILRKVF